MRGDASSESGEAAREGPLGDVVRDRWSAGVERDVAAAACARALALSPWWSISLIRERRETRFGRESTRWKKVFSSMLGLPLSSTESSQSEESSSSSIALSSISSSSSVSNTSSSNGCSSWIVRVATSSLKDVCFLAVRGRCKPLVSPLVLLMLLGKELSSSFDEPPNENMAPFFFGFITGCRLFAIEFACSLKESSPEDPPNANIVCFLGCGPLGRVALVAVRSTSGMDVGEVRRGIDLYEELTREGEKPLTTLVVLRTEVPLRVSTIADSEELLGAASVTDGFFTAEGIGICGESSDTCCG